MRFLLLITVLWLGLGDALAADIYEDPKNLQVLPADISPQDLRNTMKNFALSTGLRCSSCHVGEENQPLESYDFAADDMALKDKARAMLKMRSEINQTLTRNLGADHVQVDCVTCHRGIRKPRQLGDVLTQAAEEKGVQGLQQEYASIRARYYGTHSYDFSELTFSELAQARALAGHPEQAYAVLDILLQEKPESFQGHFMYAELAVREGNKEQAREYYQKAMQLNPQAAGFIQQRIEQLEE